MPDADRLSPAQTLDSVLAALRADGGLPSVGHTLAKLTHMLGSDTDALQSLADVILADVALTQRLLRIANTVPYRAGMPPVTTVTRAIMLLGFDHVRAAALSLVLLDGLVGEHRVQLRGEFHQTLLAGGLARELLRGDEAEEASIAAMFRSIGRLLASVYAPRERQAVRQAMQRERIGESAAARRVFSVSFEELTERVLREWSVPERIVHAVEPLPARVDRPANAAERVRRAAQFADAVAAAVGDGAADPTAALNDVLDRFRAAFDFDRNTLLPLLQRAAARAHEFESAFGLVPQPSPVNRLAEALPEEGELAPAPVEVSQQRDDVGRPANAREVLLAGLAEATECLARGAEQGGDLNAVVRVVLEAMYSGLGYARTALVLREASTGQLRTRGGFGEPKAAFSFSTQAAPNLFSAVLSHGKDLHVADVHAAKIQQNLPDWYKRDFAQAKSLLLMPLMVNGRALGFFYADRKVPDEKGLSPEELNLLRSLRSQVILAIKSR